MTRFLDGPARGQTLMLKRAPKFLRVTRDDKHSLSPVWDALDQVDDTPMQGESLFAYQCKGTPTMCHVNIRGGKGGFYPIAEYELCQVQPTDDEMRSTSAWQAWCHRMILPDPTWDPVI